MRIEIECHHCHGSGRLKLSGVYADTLAGLRRLTKAHGWTTAAKSASWFGCSPTALNNRFRVLEAHGLATSEWYGRERRYSAK